MMNLKMKMNKIKEQRNAGFSLTELVVAFAILSVVCLCVSFMMTTGSNLFNRVNKNINLSYRSQIPMNQLREYFIDCDFIYLDEYENSRNEGASQTAYLGTVEGKDEAWVYSIRYYSDQYDETKKNTITLQKEKVAGPGNFSTDGKVDETTLAKNVTSYKVEYLSESSCVNITYTVEYSGKTYTKTQLIRMRNKPTNITSTTYNSENYGTYYESLAAALYKKSTEI